VTASTTIHTERSVGVDDDHERLQGGQRGTTGVEDATGDDDPVHSVPDADDWDEMDDAACEVYGSDDGDADGFDEGTVVGLDEDEDGDHVVAGAAAVASGGLDVSKTPLEVLSSPDAIEAAVNRLFDEGEQMVGTRVFAELVEALSRERPLHGHELETFAAARIPPEKMREAMYLCFRYILLSGERNRQLAQ
jgi:hypothetical protein